LSTEFFQRYAHKVVTREALKARIGGFPRDEKVMLCHGVFDVVHPGHVRHLAYAKSKADLLAVSVTADRHIGKGVHRPHVPEQLRALNLAAFEMVDFVLIDPEATSLANLAYLQPNFYAKGFEYTSTGLPPATQAERDLVESYGGEMIFTPGDVVYSSSRFIEMAPPNLQYEKLLLLMETNGVTFERLREVVSSPTDFTVHLTGDTIVDSHTRTALIGGLTKTPTFTVLYQNKDDFIGGAGIVALHLRAAGARVVFSTVLGDDGLKDFVLEKLTASGVEVHAQIDPTRPTTHKNSIISGGYRLLKIDTLDNRPISQAILDRLCGQLREVACDAVVFSDFRHGIFSKASLPSLMEAIPKGVFKVADSQVSSRWGNIVEFKDFDLITPNEREARFALADQDSTVSRLAGEVIEKTGCGTLILKLGEKGLYCVRRQPDEENYFSIDSFTDTVRDSIGAGDALLAYATVAMLKTDCEATAAILGSLAAACECEIDGNMPVTPADILAKLDQVERRAGYSG
jgi:bifunctional ADP-heptose synthase (sugar kinase/adenylyltransferase)